MRSIVKTFLLSAWFMSISGFALFEGLRYFYVGITDPWLLPVIVLTVLSFAGFVIWGVYLYSTWRGL